jgi:PilZ domain
MANNLGRSYTRKLTRHPVPMAVAVSDAISNIAIGRLVNVHLEGLMVVGKKNLPNNNLYQLQLHLPDKINDRTNIDIGVDCLWSRSNDDETIFWAGCRIIDISDAALTDLKSLITLIEQ